MAGKGEISDEMVNGLLYTPEQVELLEQVYHECRKPNQFQRLEMINEYPYLSVLESKEIKLWFQNRRRHEKQKKMEMDCMILRDKLAATQQLLLAENARLHQELLQLEHENEYIQKLLQNASSSTTDKHCESACNPHSLETADSPARSFLLAGESHTEFLTVSKRSTIGWFPTPWMKALNCIVQLVEEKRGKLSPLCNKETLLLSFSQQSTWRLSGLNGDGRSLMNYNAAESLIMAMNSIKRGTISSFTAAVSFPGTILCVKVSLLKKMHNSNCKIAAEGEVNVAQSVEEAKDMAIAKSTKNQEDSLDVHCLIAPLKPGSTEDSMLADWICKTLRYDKGEMLLKSNGQSQESVWKRLWYIKFQGYAVLLAGICKSGAI